MTPFAVHDSDIAPVAVLSEKSVRNCEGVTPAGVRPVARVFQSAQFAGSLYGT